MTRRDFSFSPKYQKEILASHRFRDEKAEVNIVCFFFFFKKKKKKKIFFKKKKKNENHC